MFCPDCCYLLRRDDNGEELDVVSGEGPIHGHCENEDCTFHENGSLVLHHPHSDRLNDVRNTERGPGDSWSLSYIN